MPYKDPKKRRAYSKRWREAHPEYQKQWLEKRPGYHKKRVNTKGQTRIQQWCEQNPEKAKLAINLWKKNNLEKCTGYVQKYKAKKRNLPATLTQEEWEVIKAKHFYRCHYCGQKKELIREHVIPVSKEGGYTKENIVPACKGCNSSKHTMSKKKFQKRLKAIQNPELPL